jgi:hypothetical protein
MQPKIRMAEPLRFRLDRQMRTAVVAYAKTLTNATDEKVCVSAAIRDLLGRALGLGSPDAAYLSGFREGFLAGWADTKRAAARQAAAALAAANEDEECDSIVPPGLR